VDAVATHVQMCLNMNVYERLCWILFHGRYLFSYQPRSLGGSFSILLSIISGYTRSNSLIL